MESPIIETISLAAYFAETAKFAALHWANEQALGV
jgi:hypothetical protein